MDQANEFVRQANDGNFEAEVLQRSQETPVVVDFWATWCQPCLMLAPVLEKLAAENEGRFVLVKAETSEAPEAAAQFNVQSIPALFGVVDGEVVDMHVGGAPEAHLQEWIDRLVQYAALAEAKRLEESNPAAAEAKYRSALAADEEAPQPLIGLARARLAQGDSDEAASILERLESRGFLEPEAEKLKSALHIQTEGAVDLAALQAKADASPDDLEASLALAQALARVEEYEQALERCLALVQRDRQGVGEEARKLMIDVFRVLPDESELVSEYRRKLSMALF